jgi:2-keto-4-pentenoate hydratase
MREERIEDVAAALASAYRDTGLIIPAARLADLAMEEAVAVQQRVVEMLGERVPVAKVGLTPEGVLTAAPIMGSYVLESGGTVNLPKRGLVGIEVEIAARLKQDLTPEIARGDIRDALDGMICGIEIIGSRLDDRKQAGAGGQLADSITSAGYVLGGEWTGGPLIDGLELEIKADGKVVYSAEARHPVGDALRPLAMLAREGWGSVAPKAGMVITTGSLCGIVPVPMPALVSVRLGDGPEVTVRFV